MSACADGRGRGRGRGKGMVIDGSWKPKPCPIKKDDILLQSGEKYCDAEVSVDGAVRKDSIMTQKSIEIIETIAQGILHPNGKSDTKKTSELADDGIPEKSTTTSSVNNSIKTIMNDGLNKNFKSTKAVIITESLPVQASLNSSDNCLNGEVGTNRQVQPKNLYSEEQMDKNILFKSKESACDTLKSTDNLLSIDKKVADIPSDEKPINIGINEKLDEYKKSETINQEAKNCYMLDSFSNLHLSNESKSVSNMDADFVISKDRNVLLKGAIEGKEFTPRNTSFVSGETSAVDVIPSGQAGIMLDEKNAISLGNVFNEEQMCNYQYTQYDQTYMRFDSKNDIALDEKNAFVTGGNDNLSHCTNENLMHGNYQYTECNEANAVLGVLNDTLRTLMEDPGDFDIVIDNLTEHLENFLTEEENLKKVVDTIIVQAMQNPHFTFIAAKISHNFIEKGLCVSETVSFKGFFFARCKEEYLALKDLCKDAASCRESKDRIMQTSLLFGELMCIMKVKDEINPLFRRVILALIDKFLEVGSEEAIFILTRILKLVGPELDVGRPKDVEEYFKKVSDFKLHNEKAKLIPTAVMENLWRVYKMHTRDWDRVNEEEIVSSNSTVNWEEYYDGNDDNVYLNNMDDEVGDEAFDAYEEFLRTTGQLPSDL